MSYYYLTMFHLLQHQMSYINFVANFFIPKKKVPNCHLVIILLASSSTRKMQLQKSEDKRTALVAGM